LLQFSCTPVVRQGCDAAKVVRRGVPVLDADSGHSQVAILFPPAAAFFITGCSCDLLM